MINDETQWASAKRDAEASHAETQKVAGEQQDDETVSALAELYLGNILYALELSALTLDEQQKPADAAFYRGIARKLAEARGRSRQA